jgi:thiol-disulfide isomerase/thioredoxin
MKQENTSPSLRTVLGAVAIAAIAGYAAVAVYVTGRAADNVAIQEAEARANAPAMTVTAPSNGTLAAFVRRKSPEPLPELAFTDAAGKPMTLADFRGKTILLNLWATWCAPCRKEMPSLDRLQKALGSDKFEVVALALERGGIPAAQKFFDDAKVQSLKLYVDQTTRAGAALRALGMPVTILIDPQGRESGRLAGPAEWDAPEAQAMIASALKSVEAQAGP